MPVVYRCAECGRPHTAPVVYDSKEQFDAVPWNRAVGAWPCEYRPRAGSRVYTQADLFWVSEYQVAEWDDLLRLLREAREAVRQGRPGAVSELEEIEEEVAARKVRVVARYPKGEVVWAAYRSRAECLEYLKTQGVRAGVGHRGRGVRYEVIIEDVQEAGLARVRE